jgi:hypothetical protein
LYGIYEFPTVAWRLAATILFVKIYCQDGHAFKHETQFFFNIALRGSLFGKEESLK